MIRLGNPVVDEAEINAVNEALQRGILSTGEIVAEFESKCADFTDRTSAAAVSSGSVALELALQVSDIPDGSGVLVSPFNCGAVLYSILREQLRPIFVDIKLGTYNIDPDGVEGAIERASVPVEALLAVHLYGQPCEMDTLEEIAMAHDLTLIDDFAQSIGATFYDDPVGSFGDIGVGSFGATKNLTTAEGGVVVSDDTDRISRVRTLRSNTNEPVESTLLRSVRMNDIEAAIGCQQFEKYEDILKRKRAIAAIYDRQLPNTLDKPVRKSHITHVYHGYPIRTTKRNALATFLDQHDIETAAVYDTPLYDYPQLDMEIDFSSMFPNTARACQEVLLLPIHGSLSRSDAQTVTEVVTRFFERET